MTPEAIAPLRFARVSLARVHRHQEWFAAHYLHEHERAFSRALPIEKRRVDFIAGRVAAKRTLVGPGDPRRHRVLPAEGMRAGAPCLHTDEGVSTLALSIAHGADWAVAVAAEENGVGVDIERVEPRQASFVDEAFVRGELERWAVALGSTHDDPRVITVAWCAKEALLKLEGVGLRAPLPAVAPEAIELCKGVGTTSWTTGRLRAAPMGDCRLALAVDDARALVIVWSAAPRNRS